MESPADSVFELRTDPTSGRRVLIAEGRALRPNDFVEDAPAEHHSSENCPFCRGNEHATPHELAVVNNSHGDWQVRVVPNKYPAVAILGAKYSVPSTAETVDLWQSESPYGVHEVIIESPRHMTDWTEFSTDELSTVLGVFRERIEYSCNEHQLSSALIFKNVGHAAGASLEHVHSQMVALPFVPPELSLELIYSAGYYKEHRQCLLCRLLADEVNEGTRLVIENDHFAAICAYAGRQPYETWILPKVHAASFTKISAEESHALAEILGEMVRRLAAMLTPLAYNLVLHTAPVGDVRSGSYHWHWELIPRSTSLAGFEWGTGMHINSVSPERAAIRLRASKSGKKLPIQ